MRGEGMEVGDEAASWVSQFLEKDGCRVYYMAPHNKPRVLSTDPRWYMFTEPEDQVRTAATDTIPWLVCT